MTKRWLFADILLLLILSTGFVMSSCSKDKNQISVQGQVFDPNSAVSVEGATVVLSANKITSGVYSSGYDEVARAVTDAGGTFSFNFEEEKVAGYRIYISKTGYFQYTKELSIEDISPESVYEPLIYFYPIGYIKLFVKNAMPFDTMDHIAYSFTSGYINCSDCCDNSMHAASGESVDDSLKCKTYGNQNVSITWTVSKNNQITQHSGSVYCHAFDTVEYHIFY